MINELWKKDFHLFENYLKDKHRITPIFLKNNQKKIGKIHRYGFILALLDEKLKNENLLDYQYIFFKEIFSDYINSVDSIFYGQKKTSRLLLRSIIENLLKGIYFYEHKIEYFWSYTDSKQHYISIESYKEFAIKHPQFIQNRKAIDFIHELRQKYRELSTYAHTKTLDYMDLTNNFNSIAFNPREFDNYFTDFEYVCERVIVLMGLFHSSYFKSMHPLKQEFILNHIKSPHKKILRKM